jgi:type VI secretion system protein ImpK
MVAQLRNSIERADVPALRRQVVEEMDRFQQEAQKAGIDAGDIIAARYVLCATLDETVLMTPWGSRSEWSANSLLNQYHNETWGGEKVFAIIDRIKGNAEKKLQLLVLIHTCLMLGFEGRYRVLERGRDQLEDLRNELSKVIRRHTKTTPEEPLSKDAKGERKGRKIRSFIPMWMVAVSAVALLIIVYTYVDIMLSGSLRATVSKINALTGAGS